MAIKLIHSTFAKDESYCIANMLESVLPYVDESYILFDDRCNEETLKVVESFGCHIKMAKLENFGKFKNIQLEWINDKADWVFGLAPDETITEELGRRLRQLAQELQASDVDGVYFSRRHWADLEMIKEIKGNEGLKGESEWYPDWQQRLVRLDYPRIHAVRYVHEVIVGIRRSIKVQLDINHFNTYWKPKLNIDWNKMLEYYEHLKKLQAIESGYNIWPDKE